MYSPYNQYYNPYYTPISNAQNLQGQKQEVVRVNGIEGAKAYQMPPNSSVLLLDETAPIVYLKMTDGASYPTISSYKISPVENLENQSQNLEERVSRLEAMINGKSYSGRNGKSKQQSRPTE